ncbi:uncharacterized protein F5891DRAFT_991489 [Suillus fuscotomentosus]|uniref:Uncharacterized protein n=1 Tax=Suillus fuscotomentosus TaxID=1912939 RepID=A0AAD4DMH6_9AGAM|nr:uncharacterized protein F5891DRAFT_991489 [Suillus fuscotomentosus]KAG1879947.1 hypothetical protein F5891DRAFT_991489 [Suillus fuscotomentosus]
MNNDGNANVGGDRNANVGGDRNADVRGEENGNENQLPQHLFQHMPRPREVIFAMSERQIELMYVTWAAARMRVRQRVYRPEVPFIPNPLPPLWPDEVRAMMVLWIARERRMFEMEVRELEYLLGLRYTRAPEDKFGVDSFGRSAKTRSQDRNYLGILRDMFVRQPVGGAEVHGASAESSVGVVEVKVSEGQLNTRETETASAYYGDMLLRPPVGTAERTIKKKNSPVDGMSSDDHSLGNGIPVYQVRIKQWRSCKVTEILRACDALHLRMRYGGDWDASPGAGPHLRIPSLKYSTRGSLVLAVGTKGCHLRGINDGLP